jgi:hypothetical protein
MKSSTGYLIGTIMKGGPGSGNFGHTGRPGIVGGSGEGGGGSATKPADKPYLRYTGEVNANQAVIRLQEKYSRASAGEGSKREVKLNVALDEAYNALDKSKKASKLSQIAEKTGSSKAHTAAAAAHDIAAQAHTEAYQSAKLAGDKITTELLKYSVEFHNLCSNAHKEEANKKSYI